MVSTTPTVTFIHAGGPLAALDSFDDDEDDADFFGSGLSHIPPSASSSSDVAEDASRSLRSRIFAILSATSASSRSTCEMGLPRGCGIRTLASMPSDESISLAAASSYLARSSRSNASWTSSKSALPSRDLSRIWRRSSSARSLSRRLSTALATRRLTTAKAMKTANVATAGPGSNRGSNDAPEDDEGAPAPASEPTKGYRLDTTSRVASLTASASA